MGRVLLVEGTGYAKSWMKGRVRQSLEELELVL